MNTYQIEIADDYDMSLYMEDSPDWNVYIAPSTSHVEWKTETYMRGNIKSTRQVRVFTNRPWMT